MGGFDANEADLSPSWIPTAPHGTTLGLTVQQLCVKEDFGDCEGGGGFEEYPYAHFYVTWPQIRVDPTVEAIFGRKFEH